MFLWLLRSWRLAHPDEAVRSNQEFAKRLSDGPSLPVSAGRVSRLESPRSADALTADWVLRYERALGLPPGQLLDPFVLSLRASGADATVRRGPAARTEQARDWLYESSQYGRFSPHQWRDVVELLMTGTKVGPRHLVDLQDSLAMALAHASAFEESVIQDALSRLPTRGQFDSLRRVALDRSNARANHAASAFMVFPIEDMPRAVLEVAKSGDLLTAGRAIEAWGDAAARFRNLREHPVTEDLRRALRDFAASDDPGYGTSRRAQTVLRTFFGETVQASPWSHVPRAASPVAAAGSAQEITIACRSITATGLLQMDPWLAHALRIALNRGDIDRRSLVRCILRASPFARPLALSIMRGLSLGHYSPSLERDLIRFVGVLGQRVAERFLRDRLSTTRQTDIAMAAAAALCDLPLVDPLTWTLAVGARWQRSPEVCVALLNLAGSHGAQDILQGADDVHPSPEVQRERAYWLGTPTSPRIWTLQGPPTD